MEARQDIKPLNRWSSWSFSYTPFGILLIVSCPTFTLGCLLPHQGSQEVLQPWVVGVPHCQIPGSDPLAQTRPGALEEEST